MINVRSFADLYGLSLSVYVFVAGVSALVEWSTFFIVAQWINPFTAASLAFFVATSVNYVLSLGTFNSRRPRWEELGLFFSLSALVFLFNLGTFAFLYAALGTQPIIAKVAGTGVGFVINYTLRQFVIFARESRFVSISMLLGQAAHERCPVFLSKSDAAPSYAGRRILEAMREAPRYADAIYGHIRAAYSWPRGPILDFGAGDGVFVELFLRDGVAVDCVDPDLANQSALRALVPGVAADIGAVEGDRYDFVYTINVLEHLHELNRYLAELHRVLRPNGRLFVFVPAFEFLWTSLDDEVKHVQRFTRQSLAVHLKNAGFAIESSRYFDSIGFFAAFTVRILEKIRPFQYSSATISFYDKIVMPLSLLGDRLLSNIAGKNVIAIARKLG